MLLEQFLEGWKKELLSLRKVFEERLLRGVVEDYADYKELRGRMDGFDRAILKADECYKILIHGSDKNGERKS